MTCPLTLGHGAGLGHGDGHGAGSAAHLQRRIHGLQVQRAGQRRRVERVQHAARQRHRLARAGRPAARAAQLTCGAPGFTASKWPFTQRVW